jgi:hypothetical protein
MKFSNARTISPRAQRSTERPEFDSPIDAPIVFGKLVDMGGGYGLTFGRSSWGKPWGYFENEEDAPILRWRRTRADIRYEEELIGSIEIREYDSSYLTNTEFFHAMDSHSQAKMKLAYMLISAWEDVCEQVFSYGRILEISRVWINKKHSHSRIWIQAVENLINRVKRQTALIICVAFTLEYEGREYDETPERQSFYRRQRAMYRYYARHLKLSLMPGPLGEEGWMWRPSERLAEIIDKPEYRDAIDFI